MGTFVCVYILLPPIRSGQLTHCLPISSKLIMGFPFEVFKKPFCFFPGVVVADLAVVLLRLIYSLMCSYLQAYVYVVSSQTSPYVTLL